MTQTEIIKVLEKHKCLLGNEIVLKLRTDGEKKEQVRKSLKNMRKYKEIGYVLINFSNQIQVATEHPHFAKKLEEGYKVRREAYLYFAI